MEGCRIVSVKSRIEEKLKSTFNPVTLTVVDESHLHAGHAGAMPGGETHFRVTIVASAFSGKNRVERHRMINEALAEEFLGRLHALALHATAPEETSRG
jgi:BolA family transcriptional regulator, general stress-responsive regulator